jgi:hypothetical protein
MKLSILIIPLFIFSCTTTDITVNKETMQSVKIVAIAPFTSTFNLKKEIFSEAEANFRSAFVKMNYQVVGKDKLDNLMKGKESDIATVTPENAKRIGKLTGADAILIGEIIKHEEETKESHFYSNISNRNPFSNKSHDELKYTTTYKFQIIVRLVDVSDGSVIITLKNSYKDIEQNENLQCCNSLDSYRRYTLIKMADDLVETMKEKK